MFPFLRICSAFVQCKCKRCQRHSCYEQTTSIQALGHHLETLIFLAKNCITRYSNIIKCNGTCRRLAPQILAGHFLIRNIWIIHGNYETGRPVTRFRFRVCHSVYDDMTGPFGIGRPAFFSFDYPVLSLFLGSNLWISCVGTSSGFR